MATVLRGKDGEITHVHYDENMYLPKDEHRYVMETEITEPMVKKVYGNPEYVVMQLANGNKSAAMLKLQILGLNGFDYHAFYQ